MPECPLFWNFLIPTRWPPKNGVRRGVSPIPWFQKASTASGRGFLQVLLKPFSLPLHWLMCQFLSWASLTWEQQKHNHWEPSPNQHILHWGTVSIGTIHQNAKLRRHQRREALGALQAPALHWGGAGHGVPRQMAQGAGGILDMTRHVIFWCFSAISAHVFGWKDIYIYIYNMLYDT